MKLSVIIPWADFGDPWRRQSWEWLRARYAALLPDAELVYGSTDPFNRAASRNMLVERSTGDVLLIADADTVFQRTQIEAARELLLAGAPWVICYGLGRYYNLSSEETVQVLWRSPDAEVPEPFDPLQWEHRLDSWAGLLLMERSTFDKVGGYDERFDGWGYEDNAFRFLLDRSVGPHHRVDSYALHLWHPVNPQTTFDSPTIQYNAELCRRYERGELP